MRESGPLGLALAWLMWVGLLLAPAPPAHGFGLQSTFHRPPVWKQGPARWASGTPNPTPPSSEVLLARARFLRGLYWLSAVDAVAAVLCDDFRMKILLPRAPVMHLENPSDRVAASIIPRIFYFARLRPRLLWSVGALLRALQLCTPIQRVLNPSAGVGLGVNMCAIVARSRWVAPLVVGWASSGPVWRWLGARQPQGAVVPIAVSISQRASRRAVAAHKHVPVRPSTSLAFT
mmetsp:Transcript_21805/g.63444  ORF Transcript_21805/g.63444 Transcript_21805/m.63444 type:complete len:233 (+) Transcript_21805:121-819(+)